MVKKGEVGIPRSPETRAKIGISARQTRLAELRPCSYGCEGLFNSGNLASHVAKYHEFACLVKDCEATVHKGLGLCHTHHQLVSHCRKFGITVEQYLADYEKQGKSCYICGRPGHLRGSNKGRMQTLVIDHCHASGKYRGLLCPPCNLALGHFQDSISRMEKAIEYLRGHNEPST